MNTETSNENATDEVEAAARTAIEFRDGEGRIEAIVGNAEVIPKEKDTGDGNCDGDSASLASDKSREEETITTEITAFQLIHTHVLTNNTSQIGVGSVMYNSLSFSIKDKVETLYTLDYNTGDIFDCFDHPVLFLNTQVVLNTNQV